MENKSYYTVVGVFFVAVLTAIFAFVWWLSAKDGPGDQKTTHSYYIYTKELPSGLKVGSDVKYLGVSVGSVKKIDFAKISEGVINLEVSSIYQLPLRKDSLARVEVQALSGIASINITKGEGEEFKKGEVPAIKLDQSLLDKLGANAKDITQNLNDAMVQVLKIFSDENVIKITSMIKSLEEMSSNLNESGAIKSLVITAI